jgi:hypothetical protein
VGKAAQRLPQDQATGTRSHLEATGNHARDAPAVIRPHGAAPRDLEPHVSTLVEDADAVVQDRQEEASP